MSDNFSLIIKNGACYIDGKLTKTDIGLSGNKIKKIGKIKLNNSKVYDANGKIILANFVPSSNATIRLTVVPDSLDLAPVRNQILKIDPARVVTNIEIDTVAVSGTSGTIDYNTTRRIK